MITVIGATGNVGRPLVRMLAEAGAEVTAVSRGADSSAGVADLAAPASLGRVLRGAESAFLLVPGTGAHLDAAAIVGAVTAAGVRRLVLLSSQAATTRPGHAPLRALEETVQRSGLDWTHLRPTGFASNALAWAPSIRAARTAAAPFGDIGHPVVDPLDIAAVAAAVLLEDGHGGQAYELTGPARTTPRSRAQDVADALGETVRFVEQTRDEARRQMLEFMPAPVVDATLDILGSPTPAEQLVSPDVEKVLGRAPHSFADWARRNVAAFRPA
jgi:uncharacterized protein YbjT (DUF2867 family)